MPPHNASVPQAIDYAEVLRDLEAKRSAIDNAISGIRAMVHAGANQSAGTDSALHAAAKVPFNGQIAPNAFFGKSIPEAAKMYLQMVQNKQTTKEIADALQRGGMETTSSKFDLTVAAGLNRASKAQKEVVKVRGGKWALAEWLGRVAKQPNKTAPRSALVSKRGPKQETLPQKVVNVLKGSSEAVLTPADIRNALGGDIPPKDLASALIRLVKSGRAVKVGHAQYRAA